jgi:hypothetical protein
MVFNKFCKGNMQATFIMANFLKNISEFEV